MSGFLPAHRVGRSFPARRSGRNTQGRGRDGPRRADVSPGIEAAARRGTARPRPKGGSQAPPPGTRPTTAPPQGRRRHRPPETKPGRRRPTQRRPPAAQIRCGPGPPRPPTTTRQAGRGHACGGWGAKHSHGEAHARHAEAPRQRRSHQGGEPPHTSFA